MSGQETILHSINEDLKSQRNRAYKEATEWERKYNDLVLLYEKQEKEHMYEKNILEELHLLLLRYPINT